MDVLLDDLGDPKFAEVLTRGLYRLGGGFFPRSAAGPDDLDHAVHAHGVSFPGLPGRTVAGMAAGAVFRIVFVIVRASRSPGFDLSMHMRERPARCAGPPFRGTFVPQGTDRIGREKSQAAIAATTGVATFAVRAAPGHVPARRPAPGALDGTASGSAAG